MGFSHPSPKCTNRDAHRPELASPVCLLVSPHQDLVQLFAVALPDTNKDRWVSQRSRAFAAKNGDEAAHL